MSGEASRGKGSFAHVVITACLLIVGYFSCARRLVATAFTEVVPPSSIR